MSDQAPGIAIFDFDDTLVKGDSCLPFLVYVAGWPCVIAALAEAAILLPWHLRNNPGQGGWRTFFKTVLLKRTLAGRNAASLAPAVEKLRRWVKFIEPTRCALMDHHAKGHHIVIASGGLDLYLHGLLKDLPHNAIVCTEIGVASGVLTGVMQNGNCVRKRKAELVAKYMAQHEPFGESWGYGNFPHDLPMLELVKHGTII